MFTALETRRELEVRLSDAMTDYAELLDLIDFLIDDLAYDPDNRAIVGAVLRDAEHQPWSKLMLAAKELSFEKDHERERIRQLASELLSAMRERN